MSAPLVVNTRDGVCWTRRTVTSGGIALYAPESVKTCPAFVMATIDGLAEHGIVGSADALPMPVGSQTGDRRERYAAAVLQVKNLAGLFADVRAHVDPVMAVADSEMAELRARVAALEAERHETNKVLSDSAEALRANRDRIAELEARLAEREQSAGTYPPALPWAKLMDHEDLADFLDELAASAITYATAEVALTEVEDAIARWRLIAEAQHAHNTAPGPNALEDRPGMRHAVRTEDDVTPQVAKLRTLLAGQREQTGGTS